MVTVYFGDVMKKVMVVRAEFGRHLVKTGSLFALSRNIAVHQLVVKLCDGQYELFVAGHAAPRKRRKYEEADARILNIVNRYELGTVIEYLRGISHNFNIV
uniref:Transposase n=1 Tax=Meloidogyne hapla TaxID=6305 RepID=A0A1I8B9K9_MELHA